MPIAGIYSPVEDPYEHPPEEITFRREAAFDTDRGGWLSNSDGEIVAEFDTEALKRADIDTVLDTFYDRYKHGHHLFYIRRESRVPGEIVEGAASFGPCRFEEVEVIETEEEQDEGGVG